MRKIARCPPIIQQRIVDKRKGENSHRKLTMTNLLRVLAIKALSQGNVFYMVAYWWQYTARAI
jgi:hypothetical protein